MRIASNDRVIAVGKTGSGKTTLMRTLTGNLTRLVVLDGKGSLADWGLGDWETERLSFVREGQGRLRAALPVGEGVDYWDRVISWALDQGDLTVYIDEIGAIVPPGGRASTYLHALYTRGREWGIGAWGSTQRPAWIPLICISECEHFFVFRLTMAEDRARMAQFMTERVMQTISEKYAFWYYSLESENLGLYKLRKPSE
jgi:energy-coupling factor transporter ATP-binding protein EcfA2